MAICRFGPDSDVHVYYCTTGGISCSRCELTRGALEFRARDEPEMIVHLERHVAAGHRVPNAAFLELAKPSHGGH